MSKVYVLQRSLIPWRGLCSRVGTQYNNVQIILQIIWVKDRGHSNPGYPWNYWQAYHYCKVSMAILVFHKKVVCYQIVNFFFFFFFQQQSLNLNLLYQVKCCFSVCLFIRKRLLPFAAVRGSWNIMIEWYLTFGNGEMQFLLNYLIFMKNK